MWALLFGASSSELASSGRLWQRYLLWGFMGAALGAALGATLPYLAGTLAGVIGASVSLVATALLSSVILAMFCVGLMAMRQALASTTHGGWCLRSIMLLAVGVLLMSPLVPLLGLTSGMLGIAGLSGWAGAGVVTAISSGALLMVGICCGVCITRDPNVRVDHDASSKKITDKQDAGGAGHDQSSTTGYISAALQNQKHTEKNSSPPSAVPVLLNDRVDDMKSKDSGPYDSAPEQSNKSSVGTALEKDKVDVAEHQGNQHAESSDPNISDNSEDLIAAAAVGQVAKVKSLLEQPHDINLISQRSRTSAGDISGYTALMWAVKSPWCPDDVAKLLIDKGHACPNVTTDAGITALMLAAQEGSLKVANMLVEASASLDVQDQVGCTALMYAAKNGHTQVVEYLIEQNADRDCTTSIMKNTALMDAAQGGHVDIVKALTEGQPVTWLNQCDDVGNTAILYAAKAIDPPEENQVKPRNDEDKNTKRAEVVQHLVRLSADPNCQDQQKRTALMYAAERGRTGMVKAILTSEKIEINAQDEWGRTALMCAVKAGDGEAVAAILSKAADASLPTNMGGTPLMCAAIRGDMNIMKALVAKNVDLNAQTTMGVTALMLASQVGHLPVVKYLTSSDINPDLDDDMAMQALLCAADAGHLKVVEHLVDCVQDPGALINRHYGCRIDESHLNLPQSDQYYCYIQRYLIQNPCAGRQKATSRQTALICAAGRGHHDVVDYLIKLKVNPNVRNSMRETALICALKGGYTTVMKALLTCKDINVDVQDKGGCTALYIAAADGNTSAVVALMDKGADTKLSAAISKTTPLMAATHFKRSEVIEILSSDDASKHSTVEMLAEGAKSAKI